MTKQGKYSQFANILLRAIPFEILRGGADWKQKIKVCGGGAPGIFSSPSPPEDFKWNSPQLWCTHVGQEEPKLVYTLFCCKPVIYAE